MSRFIYLVLFLVMAGTATCVAAPADGLVQEVESLARQASAAYKQGEYEKAIELYLSAYALRETGALLYNIAVVYDRKLRDDAKATTYYRRYINCDDARQTLSERARTRIEFFERRAREARERRQRIEESPKESQETVVETTTTREVSAPSKAPIWFIWSGGGLLAAGGVYWGLAFFESERFSNSRILEDKKLLRKSAQSKALTGDVLGLVGASAVLTGVVWALIVGGDDTSPRQVMIEPGVGGLTVRGSF